MSRPPHLRTLPKRRSTVAEFFWCLSVRRKLALAFGVKALLTLAACLTAIVINVSIKVQVQQIDNAAINKAEGVSSMAESLRELRWHRLELLLNHAQPVDLQTENAANARTAEIVRAISEDIDQFRQQGIVACRTTTQASINTGVKHHQTQVIDEAHKELARLDEIERKFTGLENDLRSGLSTHVLSTPSDFADSRINQQFNAVNELVEDYEVQMKNQDKHQTHEVEHDLRRANLIFILFAVLVVVINSFLTVFFTKMISRPLETLMTAARDIGRGKLDGEIKVASEDEFGLLALTLNKMQQELRSTTVSKDYLDSILKSMANTLIVMRADRTIRSANRSLLDLLDYSTFDLVNKPLDFVLRDLPSRPISVLDEVVQKGSVSEVEVLYVARDGRCVSMAFSASTLYDFGGTVSGYICVAQDISERKRAEAELAKANRSLQDTSRQAGMAEVATSVLHNVGNVLNSVNVSGTLITEKVRKSKLVNLAKAVALIGQHENDLAEFFTTDPKGRQLPGYLSKLSANLLSEHQEINEEASQLVKNILHIRDIVAVQQNYARVGGLTEKIEVRELIEDALRINSGALDRHQVKLEREYSDLPTIVVDKHKVLQILVNLVRNAKYACDDSGRQDKRVILRATQEMERIKISVIDNGIGIPAENLERIFSHGFTTRKEGHGFGLHSGALAALEMGGSLTAYSDGPTRGATFTLELPLTPQGPS